MRIRDFAAYALLSGALLSGCTQSPATLQCDAVGEGRYVPEHERTLDAVLMSQDGAAFQSDLVQNLPRQTELAILVPDERRGRLPEREHTSISYDSKFRVTEWTHDLLEVVARTSGSELIVPKTLITREGKRESSDFLVDALMEAGYCARTSHLEFNGGDVIQERSRGKDILFVGRATVLQNIDADCYRDCVLREFQEEFGADRAIMLPTPFDGPLSYLDQAVLFYAPGHVVIGSLDLTESEYRQIPERISAAIRNKEKEMAAAKPGTPRYMTIQESIDVLQGIDDPQRTLRDIAATMEDMQDVLRSEGYIVHRLPLNPVLTLSHQSYLGGIPYTDGVVQRYIQPAFGVRSDLATAKFFTNLQVYPTLVSDRLSPWGGGPHASVQIISEPAHRK